LSSSSTSKWGSTRHPAARRMMRQWSPTMKRA
jgi:hypothetical protein